MKIKNISCLFVLLAVLGYPGSSHAQVPTGKYQIVGALNDGQGFYGVVNIQQAGPISFTVQHKTNEKYRLSGRVTETGGLVLTSIRGNGLKAKLKGGVSLKSSRYGISKNFSVVGLGRGIFVLVKI